MPRPRKIGFSIGDKVKHKEKEGVVVFVHERISKPYNVHFYPNGRGLFDSVELKKVNPSIKYTELVDSDDCIKEISDE